MAIFKIQAKSKIKAIPRIFKIQGIALHLYRNL